MEIKSAEEILNKWYKPLDKIGDIAFIQLTEAMKEYAEQFIDLASEEATSDYACNNWNCHGEGVDKESILKIKKQIK